MNIGRLARTLCLALAVLAPGIPQPLLGQTDPEGAITIGRATDARACDATTMCATGRRIVSGQCGVVADAAGREWTVPAEPATGRTCANIYDDCNGPGVIEEYELESVVVDEGGAEITGVIHGDNYFELYVNGDYICRDPTAFIPFGVNAVRFTAQYPITYALRLVDWEEHLGVGMEYERYNVGDGGVAARFSDGTETDSEWRCQVFYIAPLDDRACVDESVAGQRMTGQCLDRPQCADRDPDQCQALHFEVPDDWTAPGFDDSGWPMAKVWPEDVVSPTGAYRELRERFASAEFIWTDNLRIDNHVLCRVTVRAPE